MRFGGTKGVVSSPDDESTRPFLTWFRTSSDDTFESSVTSKLNRWSMGRTLRSGAVRLIVPITTTMSCFKGGDFDAEPDCQWCLSAQLWSSSPSGRITKERNFAIALKVETLLLLWCSYMRLLNCKFWFFFFLVLNQLFFVFVYFYTDFF